MGALTCYESNDSCVVQGTHTYLLPYILFYLANSWPYHEAGPVELELYTHRGSHSKR